MILAKRNNLNPSFNSIFEDFFSPSVSEWSTYKPNRSKVAVKVKEEESKYTIEVAAPGYKREDFKIRIENNVLYISSENKKENAEASENNYSRKEFSFEAFERSFTLQEGIIDDAKINANYRDGILYVELPKSEAAKPKPVKHIEIA
ncbi:MAG: Hsp20/alpha crystallin family protein [Bacteroidales bacterium]|nr:Hsp20/alpha crystallin family protein [Bacteroidales bacterium]